MQAYRIVEMVGGKPHTLHHTHGGSRELPVGRWLIAERKMVRDGGAGVRYESGFHVLPTEDAARKLMRRFRKARELAIVVVDVRGCRPKPTKTEAILARRMRIRSESCG